MLESTDTSACTTCAASLWYREHIFTTLRHMALGVILIKKLDSVGVCLCHPAAHRDDRVGSI